MPLFVVPEQSGEAAAGDGGWSVLWAGELSFGQWRRLKLWCSSSSSAGRGIPSSWLRDRALKQSSSFWKGGLIEEEGDTERFSNLVIDRLVIWQKCACHYKWTACKTLNSGKTTGAHRLSGVRSQQDTASGKKAGGQSSGRNFSTNFPTFRPKSRVLGRHSGSA